MSLATEPGIAESELEAEPAPAGARMTPLAVLFFALAMLVVGFNIIMLSKLLGPRPYMFQYVYYTFYFHALVLPPLMIASGAGALIAIRRGARAGRWMKRLSAASLTLGVAIAGVSVWATQIEPEMLSVQYIEIPTPKLSKPLRVLHITDIQTPGVGEYEERAFAMMRETHPDLVIHTGDLLQPLPPETYDSQLPKIAALLETLDAPMGVYHVNGDVDYGIWGRRDLGGIGGMQMLYNEGLDLTAPGGETVRLFCLELNESRYEGASIKWIRRWLGEGEDEDLTILGGHAPDYILEAQQFPIDLCLAGHTHGGQVRIPFFGPLVILSRVPRKLAMGFHEIGMTRINVSPGVGAEHVFGLPSIRINCPPSMTVFDFTPQTP